MGKVHSGNCSLSELSHTSSPACFTGNSASAGSKKVRSEGTWGIHRVYSTSSSRWWNRVEHNLLLMSTFCSKENIMKSTLHKLFSISNTWAAPSHDTSECSLRLANEMLKTAFCKTSNKRVHSTTTCPTSSSMDRQLTLVVSSLHLWCHTLDRTSQPDLSPTACALQHLKGEVKWKYYNALGCCAAQGISNWKRLSSAPAA